MNQIIDNDIVATKEFHQRVSSLYKLGGRNRNIFAKVQSLYFSDLNNISSVLPVFKQMGYSLPKSIFNKGSDLMLYNSSTVSGHKKPDGIASTIETLTR